MLLKSNYFKNFLISLGYLILFSIQIVYSQNNWHYSTDKNDLRQMYMEQSIKVFGQACTGQLRFICTQDDKNYPDDISGALSMEFTIYPVSKIKNFNYMGFQESEYPAKNKDLIKITLINNKKRTEFKAPLGSWWNGYIKDAFTFGYSTLTKDKSGNMRKILDQILSGAQTIEITVYNKTDQQKFITASFPLASGKKQFQALMKGIK